MPYGERTEKRLKRLPYMPMDDYEAGWVREEKWYPSFKEYLWTAEERLHYDVFVDVDIKGETRSYWIYYGTVGSFSRNMDAILNEALTDITEQLEESDPELVEVMEVKYYWRSRKAEEEQ